MKVEREDVLLAVTKLIWNYEITIAEFFDCIGVDLDTHRVNADQEIAEMGGILRGWETSPSE